MVQQEKYTAQPTFRSETQNTLTETL